MSGTSFKGRGRGATGRRLTMALLSAAMVGGAVKYAQSDSNFFFPGNLVVSRSLYDNNPNTLVVGTTALPPNCQAASGLCTTPPKTAISDGTYPSVWNNDSVDGSFGISSKIRINWLRSPIL
jgi:hypothetical protein